jgi:hypothetical protein
MQDAPGFAHRRARNHGKWWGMLVNLLGFLHAQREAHPLESEGVGIVLQKLLHLGIERCKVAAEAARCPLRQGAVHEDGHLRQLPSIEERVEMVEQLLRTPHAERRNQQHTPAVGNLGEELLQPLPHLLGGLMAPCSVGGFAQQHIHLWQRLRRWQQQRRPSPDIASNPNPQPLCPLAYLQHNLRRAQDVPRVEEAHNDPGQELHRLMVLQRDAPRQGWHDILQRVERLDLLPTMAAQVFGIVLLNVRAIAEQNLQQLDGGRRGIDGSCKAQLHQTRQVPRVVNVRMGQHDRVNGGGVKGKALVPLPSLGTPSLEEPAVNQELPAPGPKQEARARHRPRRPKEAQLHRYCDACNSWSASW